jgi:hypothetical protein
VKYLDSSANISPDGAYRYWLSRRLTMGERSILFVGLNPSTADHQNDDPTIRRCVSFAKLWGFDWLWMGNLYAYRSTDPKVLQDAICPIGPLNQDELKWLVHRAQIVVAAWGSNRLNPDAQVIADWICSLSHARCLGKNKNGSPKHPLYLSKTTKLRSLSGGTP